MAGNTYTWTGAVSDAGSLAGNWTPTSGPPGPGDTTIENFGTVDITDYQFSANTGHLNAGTLQVFNNTTILATSSASATTTLLAGATGAAEIDVFGGFVNAGLIEAVGTNVTLDVFATAVGTAVAPGYFINDGTILVTAGHTLTINVGASAELFNAGSIIADGGKVLITAAPSAISGGVAAVNAFYVIEGGGTLETQACYPLINGNLPGGTTPRYEFADTTPGNTLKIDNLGSFGGAVVGFQAGDTVDLGTSLAVGALAYNVNTGVLELENATGTILDSLFLSANGMTTSGTFAVTGGTADGIIVETGADGDTLLTTNRTYPEASGASGTWQSTASWNGGIIAGVTDTALIGLGDSANFTLTTGTTAVSVNSISIFDPQASVRITSDTTVLPGIASVYTGTLEVTGGNTLTTSTLRTFESGSSILVDALGTVDVTGRPGTTLAAVGGTLAIEAGNSSAVQISGGTLVVDGALLAGPAAAGGGGGSLNIAYDSTSQPASVIVNSGGTVTDTHSLLGSDPTSFGELILNGLGASWTDTIDVSDTAHSTGYMDVGYNDLSSNTPAGLTAPGPVAAAQLLIENGATLTDQENANIGDSADSAGNVTVTTGGFWNLASNGVGGLGVGVLGSGTLSVLNGGSVAVGALGTFYNNGTTFNSGGIGVGQSAGANGTVIVSGAGSQLSTLNGMAVGKGGQGLLDILNGGTVLVEANGIGVGQTADAASSGTVIVGGSGAPAALDFAATAGGLAVGSASQGTLIVADNGTVNLDGTGYLTIGSAAGSTGSVVVGGTAASAVINIGTEGLTVGNTGTGYLTVNSLGTVALTGTGPILLGQNAGAVGTMTVNGTSAVVTLGVTTNGLGVGDAGQGVVQVLNGGSVSLSHNGIGIGEVTGGSGTVLVSGTASVITLGTSTTGIGVGQGGHGLLEVENGGTVSVSSPSNSLGIGENGGSSGTVVVSGAGALLALAAGNPGINVGVSGQGLLEVLNDGTVSALAPSSGVDAGDNSGSSGTIVVSGAGALLAMGAGTGGTHIGVRGLGLLEVQSGGSVDIVQNNLDLGGAAGASGGPAPLGGDGTVAVTTGSKIDVGANLYVFAGSTVSVDGTSGIDVGASDAFITGKINLESGHSIIGNGLIAAPVENNGVIEASNATAPNQYSPGTLEIQGSITGTGVLQTGNGILRLDVAPPSGQTIQFGTGSELILNAPGTALANPITGLSDGDKIEFGNGMTITSASLVNGDTIAVSFHGSGGLPGIYDLTNVSFAAGSGTSFYWGTDPSNGLDDIQVATPNANWIGGAIDTLYSDAGNWQGDQVPNATDNVNFVSNPGTVTGTGSALELNIGPYNQANSGTWFFNGATLTVAGSPSAPYPPFAAGFYANTVLNGGTLNAAAGETNIGNVDGVTVTAQGGAQVTTLGDSIGTNTGQSGALVLTGNGTKWTEQAGPAINGYSVGYLTLGGYGGPSNDQAGSAGYLTVTDDAALNTGEGATLAGGSGNFGGATISAGGAWTVGSGLTVGQGGTGTLAVNDGLVNVTGYVGIGQNTGADGAVSVTNSGIFNAGTALTVGYQGAGTLAVGTGTVSTTGNLSVGGGTGGSGVVSLTNGTITATTGVQVGGSGAGSMTINGGGTVLAGGTSSGVGTGAGGAGNLIINAGGVWDATTLQQSNSYVFGIGQAAGFGTLAAATGNVLVTGPGALLNTNGNPLSVGQNGGGTLVVASGGTVETGSANSNTGDNSFTVGRNGTGVVVVTGSGADGASEIIANGFAVMGRAGSANVTIENGGSMLIGVDPTDSGGLSIGVGSSGANNGQGGNGEVTVTTDGVLTSDQSIGIGGNGVNGEVYVNTGGTVQVGTSLSVGTATNISGTIYGGSGALSIGAGGTVELTGAPSTTSFEVFIGNANSSIGGPTDLATGEVTVSGVGALLNTNDNGMAVGFLSNGVLTIGQGATVETGTTNSNDISALSIGRQGDGSVLVDGGTLLANGDVYVGRAGAGDLVVENHGSVNMGLDGSGGTSDEYLQIGGESYNTGGTVLYVGGLGSMEVGTDGTVTSQLAIQVGDDGTNGNLSINSGGLVETDQQIVIGLSTTIVAGDTLISPAGTTVVTGATLEAGDGSVDVGPGGTLETTGTLSQSFASVYIGVDTGATGDVMVHGAGALLSTGGNGLDVGAQGDGSLTVSQGGSVMAGTGFASQAAAVIGGDATGAVTVTDAGSNFTADGGVAVGGFSTGSLLIENQASVFTGGNTIAPTQGLDVGADAGGAGSVTVTGDGSLLDNTGGLIVGDAGLGSMSIESGGTVITTPGTVVGVDGAVIANTATASGSSVNVDGTGSDWQVTGTLIVGDAAQGGLDIASGATVTATSLVAAAQSGGDGVITVAGTGSEIAVTGSLALGAQGAGELSILSGATVSALDLTIGGTSALSSGNVDVEGAGSELSIATGGALNIGVASGGGGVLTIGSDAILNFAGIPTENGHASFNNYGTVDPDGFEYTTASNGNAGLNLYDLYIGNIGAVQVSAGTSTWFTPMVLTGTSVADAANNIGNNGDVGEWQLSSDGTLVFNANTVDAGQAIVFEDATDTLVIGQVVNGGGPGISGVTPTVAAGAMNLLQAGGFAAELWGYQAGDQILLDNLVVNADSIVGGNTLELFGAGGTLLGELTFYNKAGTRPLGTSGMDAAAAQILASSAPCFAAGTRIASARGEVAVEAIAVGERVRVLLGDAGDGLGGDGLGGDGLAEVIWVGRREVDCVRHPQPKKVWPVRVAAGAFGEGRPHTDLWLSPDHAVYVAEVLIPVKYLINGTTIAQVPVDSITYHHIELAQHDVLLAEGLPVESYLDIKDGRNYPDRAGPVRLYPDYTARMWEAFGCARLVVTGPELQAARALVAGVAGQQEAA